MIAERVLGTLGYADPSAGGSGRRRALTGIWSAAVAGAGFLLQVAVRAGAVPLDALPRWEAALAAAIALTVAPPLAAAGLAVAALWVDAGRMRYALAGLTLACGQLAWLGWTVLTDPGSW